MTSLLIPTCDRYARGWPKHDEDADPAEYLALDRVFLRSYPDDRHFAAYSEPTIPYRLAGDAFARLPVRMVLAVFDVDHPLSEERALVERLFNERPGYCFSTRGGYRLVYRLPEPIVIRDLRDVEAWRQRYAAWCDELARFEIRADRACVDWPRLYRLPWVVRDGVAQVPTEIGWAGARDAWPDQELGVWDVPVDVSHVVLEERTGTATPLGSAPEDVEAAAALLAAHWPKIPGNGKRHEAGLALAGALTKGGWGVEDTALFLADVDRRSGGESPLEDQRKRARDSAAAGERAAGWGSLAELVPVAAQAQGILSGAAALEDMFSAEQKSDPELACDAPNLHDLGLCSCPAPVEFALAEIEASPWEQALAWARERVGAELGAERPSKIEPLFMSGLDLLQRDREPVRWLVRGLATIGGLTILGGEPKTTKTWMLCEIALSIATGTAVFGTQPTAAPERVAYFFAEDDAEAVRSRFLSLASAKGLDPVDAMKNLFLCPRGRFLDLLRDDDVALVVASCKIIGPVSTVILEPLRDLHSGEEDKSDSIGPLFKRLRLIGEIIGQGQGSSCTPMIAHHMKKSADGAKARGGQRLRGSSAMHGSVVNGLYISEAKTEVGAGGTVFTNYVESEIKGARSMGAFSVTLTVTDGPDDTAVHAAWTIDRDAKPVKDDDLEQRILEIIRVHPEKCLPGKTALYEAVGGNKNTFNFAVSDMMRRGMLAVSDRHPIHGARMKKIIVLGPNGIAGPGEALDEA